jgi:hypothetical protein
MNTLIADGWAYQQFPIITVAIPVGLAGSYVFPAINEEKLKLLREEDEVVFYEENGIKYQILPIDAALEYPSVVAPEGLQHHEFSPGLLFLASVNSSSFLPQLIFGEKYTYITDGMSLVAYTKSQLSGFGIHKDAIKTMAKFGSDFVVAHDPEGSRLYGHNASNYFVAACDDYIDRSVHNFCIEFEKQEGVNLPDEFYGKLYNIIKTNSDVLVEFGASGIDFMVERTDMRATAHIDGEFEPLSIRVPAYLSKCLPDISCKTQLVGSHLKLINEFLTMVVGE